MSIRYLKNNPIPMKLIDWKNTFGDIQRVAWSLWSYLVFLALGFFICYYLLNDERPVVSCACSCPVISTGTVAKVVIPEPQKSIILPAILPDGGAK